MDAIYRTQRHFYDLTRKFYLLGRDALIDGLSPPPDGKVLEIGCGTGRNLIVAAGRWPHARFYGIDISAAMLDTARANVARSGLSNRIVLAQGDATAFDAQALFGTDKFDRVFQSYALSMIPDWRGALHEGVAKVARGGSLDIVDFGQQERLPRWFRSMLFAWLGKFDVSPRADLFEVVDAMAPNAHHRSLHRGYAWSARILRD